MSHEAVTWAMDDAPMLLTDTGRPDTTARHVLQVLAEHAHTDGSNAYPSVTRLQYRTGYDRRTVQRALRRLETGSLIAATGENGGRTIYRLALGVKRPASDMADLERAEEEQRESAAERKRRSREAKRVTHSDAVTVTHSEDVTGDVTHSASGRHALKRRDVTHSASGRHALSAAQTVNEPSVEPSTEPTTKDSLSPAAQDTNPAADEHAGDLAAAAAGPPTPQPGNDWAAYEAAAAAAPLQTTLLHVDGDEWTDPRDTHTSPAQAAARVDQHDEQFEEFWQTYPRKVAKAAARKKWAAAMKADVDPEHIITGARRYATERTNQDPKFTAHPATWLGAERYDDEPPATQGAFLVPLQGGAANTAQSATDDMFARAMARAQARMAERNSS